MILFRKFLSLYSFRLSELVLIFSLCLKCQKFQIDREQKNFNTLYQVLYLLIITHVHASLIIAILKCDFQSSDNMYQFIKSNGIHNGCLEKF